MGNSLIRARFSSSRLHSISGTTQGIDMVPNNFQIELKGLPTATSQFTGVKHVTHRETGWENNGSKEAGLEYDGFIVYINFLNLGNLELEWYYLTYVFYIIWNYARHKHLVALPKLDSTYTHEILNRLTQITKQFEGYEPWKIWMRTNCPKWVLSGLRV